MGTERHGQTAIGALALVVPMAGAEPPTAFRLFAAGWNATEKGQFLFDAEAASAVMSAYEAHGVDRMIDLEHLSLDPESRHFDPDARGWCKLEVREGELWAVDVRWTPDGAARLTEKRQRYVSPAFDYDRESRRVTRIVNIAITALPATHGTPALVAARDTTTPRRLAATGDASMTLDEMIKVAEALGLGPDATVDDFLAKIAALSKMGQPPAEEEAAPPSEPMMAPEMEASAAPVDDPKKDEMAAASSRLIRLSGKATLSAALDDVAAWRASYLEREAEHAKLAAERAALEAGERRKLVADLVKLGAETPHTSGLASNTVCKRLADEPLDELRARVVALSKRPANAAPRAATTDEQTRSIEVNGKRVELSARELAFCAETGAKPEVYAANKIKRSAARRGGE